MTDAPKFEKGTFYGNKTTPKLTAEQKARVVELLAAGKTMKVIQEDVGCSYGRIRQVKDSKSAAEASLIFQALNVTPRKLEAMASSLTLLTKLTDTLVSEVNAVKGELRKANKALYRRQLELKKSRETVREQKARIAELTRLLHIKSPRSLP
jgi:septal ring factor EnvC (AmiA/AmiB activator)